MFLKLTELGVIIIIIASIKICEGLPLLENGPTYTDENEPSYQELPLKVQEILNVGGDVLAKVLGKIVSKKRLVGLDFNNWYW